MPRTATPRGLLDDLFGNLIELPHHGVSGPPGSPRYRISDLAARLGVPPRRVRRWIWTGVFPETPYWHTGATQPVLDRLDHALGRNLTTILQLFEALIEQASLMLGRFRDVNRPGFHAGLRV